MSNSHKENRERLRKQSRNSSRVCHKICYILTIKTLLKELNLLRYSFSTNQLTKHSQWIL